MGPQCRPHGRGDCFLVKTIHFMFHGAFLLPLSIAIVSEKMELLCCSLSMTAKSVWFGEGRWVVPYSLRVCGNGAVQLETIYWIYLAPWGPVQNESQNASYLPKKMLGIDIKYSDSNDSTHLAETAYTLIRFLCDSRKKERHVLSDPWINDSFLELEFTMVAPPHQGVTICAWSVRWVVMYDGTVMSVFGGFGSLKRGR